MRIEIFVVTTELEKLNDKPFQKAQRIESHTQLIKCKTDLVRLFGGLTEKTNFKGYWINDKGKIELDSVTLWLIYTEHNEPELDNILLRIKRITKQSCQAYAIDNEMYCI